MLKSSLHTDHSLPKALLKSAEKAFAIFKCINLSGVEFNYPTGINYTITSSQPDLTLEITPVGHTSGPVSYDDMVVTYTQASGSDGGLYSPKLTTYQDFYPYGMVMPGLKLQGAEKYRFAYQGQEKDEETNKEAFQLRMWDARIARWLTRDPYSQYVSPYLGMGNNPVSRIDPDGGIDDDIYHNNGKEVARIKNDQPDRYFHVDKGENGGWTVNREFFKQGDDYFTDIRFGRGTRGVFDDRTYDAQFWGEYKQFIDYGIFALDATLSIATLGISSPSQSVAFSRIGVPLKPLSAAGKIAFWSRAESEAIDAGHMVLRYTDEGKFLSKLTKGMDYYPGSPSYKMWGHLSARYAKAAKGTVHVFQNADQGVGLKSIWRVYEYPALKNNLNVTHIKYHH